MLALLNYIEAVNADHIVAATFWVLAISAAMCPLGLLFSACSACCTVQTYTAGCRYFTGELLDCTCLGGEASNVSLLQSPPSDFAYLTVLFGSYGSGNTVELNIRSNSSSVELRVILKATRPFGTGVGSYLASRIVVLTYSKTATLFESELAQGSVTFLPGEAVSIQNVENASATLAMAGEIRIRLNPRPMTWLDKSYLLEFTRPDSPVENELVGVGRCGDPDCLWKPHIGPTCAGLPWPKTTYKLNEFAESVSFSVSSGNYPCTQNLVTLRAPTSGFQGFLISGRYPVTIESSFGNQKIVSDRFGAWYECECTSTYTEGTGQMTGGRWTANGQNSSFDFNVRFFSAFEENGFVDCGPIIPFYYLINQPGKCGSGPESQVLISPLTLKITQTGDIAAGTGCGMFP